MKLTKRTRRLLAERRNKQKMAKAEAEFWAKYINADYTTARRMLTVAAFYVR